MWAKILGLILVGRSILSDASPCGMSLSHWFIGNSSSNELNPASRWCFPVSMDLSAALARWQCGGTFWEFTLLFVKHAQMSVEASLSRMFIVGLIPLASNRLYVFSYTLFISMSPLFLISSIKMALASHE